MEYAKLRTATLAQVDDNYYYGAYCRRVQAFEFPTADSRRQRK